MSARGTLVRVALALLLVGTPGPGTHAEEAAPSGGPAVRGAPAPPDIDLRGIRNIFRYGDTRADGPRRSGEGSARAGTEPAPVPEPALRARLVGLVERGGRAAAALSIDGEVVVLGPGESRGGFTVLEVSDEAVRLRGPGGEEESLLFP